MPSIPSREWGSEKTVAGVIKVVSTGIKPRWLKSCWFRVNSCLCTRLCRGDILARSFVVTFKLIWR